MSARARAQTRPVPCESVTMCLNILIVTLAAVSVKGMPQFALLQPQVYEVQYVPAVDRIQLNNNSYRNFNQNQLNVVVYEIESSNQAVKSEIVSNRRGEVSQNNQANGNAERNVYDQNRQAGSAVSNAGKQSFEPIPEHVQQNYYRQNTAVVSRNVQDSGFENTEVSSISKPYEDNPKPNNFGDSTSRNTRINEDASLRSGPSRSESAGILYQESNKNPVTPNIIYNREQSVNVDNSNRKAISPYKNQYDNQITTNTNNYYDNDQNINESVSNDNLPRAETRHNSHENEGNAVTEDPYIAPGFNENNDSKNNTNVNVLNEKTGNDSAGAFESNTLAPGSRSGLDAPGNVDEDRWVWNVTEPIITTTPLVEKRVSFDGGSCPTGKIRVAGQCVIVDT